MTDGQGYYAYLPAIFLYHDLQFEFVENINKTYYRNGKDARYVVRSERGNVNKYFVGTAVMQAPFFIGGCILSWIAGMPADGYSWPFQIMIGIAALVYLAGGLYLLGKLLLGLKFTQSTTVLTLVMVLFGTNLLYYSVYEPSMSHVYSFFTISWFLLSFSKLCHESTGGHMFSAAVALGLTVLIRPTNAIILLSVPVITSGVGGTIMLTKSLLQRWKALVFAISTLALIIALQPIIYFLQTGSPMVWSYEGEGFNFLTPAFKEVLFSYRKGLFIYCPILLLSIIGLGLGMRKDRGRYLWLLVFVIALTWLISSWWMWYYGGCYGHRAFIEFYPVFAIGIAASLKFAPKIFSRAIFPIIGAGLICVQLIQTYQYTKHIIPFDNMTKQKYWNLFLRTGDDLAWYYSGYEGQDAYTALDSLQVTHTLEANLGWGNESQITDSEAYAGSRSARMTPDDQYGLTYKQAVGSLSLTPDAIRISGWFKSDSWSSDLSIVCSVEDSTGASYYWKKYPLRPQFDGDNWSWCTALFRCGTLRDSTDQIGIYPMKSDGSTVFIDDLEISFLKLK
jgi:hypothetical protein